MQVHTEVTISAAHHLPGYKGKCATKHGHNWKVEILADGDVDKKTGMVVDFSELKAIVNELDHTNLNKFIRNPTAENIVKYLLRKFYHKYPTLFFDIKVWESDKSWASDYHHGSFVMRKDLIIK
jgi:6-pyruvoyltetrahydropterin/6-carboxytetrahydropterin synthase